MKLVDETLPKSNLIPATIAILSRNCSYIYRKYTSFYFMYAVEMPRALWLNGIVRFSPWRETGFEFPSPLAVSKKKKKNCMQSNFCNNKMFLI